MLFLGGAVLFFDVRIFEVSLSPLFSFVSSSFVSIFNATEVFVFYLTSKDILPLDGKLIASLLLFDIINAAFVCFLFLV